MNTQATPQEYINRMIEFRQVIYLVIAHMWATPCFIEYSAIVKKGANVQFRSLALLVPPTNLECTRGDAAPGNAETCTGTLPLACTWATIRMLAQYNRYR